MSNLDWNNPNAKNEDYWRELFKITEERLNIVNKYVDKQIYKEGLNFCYANIGDFKILKNKLFELIENILYEEIWVDPYLQYTKNKLDSFFMPTLQINTNTTSLTPCQNYVAFPYSNVNNPPQFLRPVICPYDKENELNKVIKFYHDELLKRRYTICAINENES